ncbi:hypothetical protein M407DRAFT_86262 [Tulasnella calospora MUT 4182]|uniref:Serine-threonine/tyrosine-protein kinase catalytic domain-containing protein n=1 Tax=Tulasnella calospora MUT 4182 TaxID=1051891 RepID=A0A0C3Q1S5_9AGAM|nr:hypothetical protein M407DRAFT_86262 [Tulasnella calospora MUT 4182]
MQPISNGQAPNPTDHTRLPEADPLWSLIRGCWSRDPTDWATSDTILQKVEFNSS